ncbi:hypothetical protein [uncultured Litoreibacter sp.]|uniref:hypothetical protein n=1 Tax=uncultured Litoreibacter sp. TaxID=1392394 RepID=UPI00260AD4B5|nr:hypothetical protein [uncultured Litoreibacter sp.]
MQIALHLGVHCTDEDRLTKCLRRNAEKLAEEGINVPDVSRYRPVIREAMHVLQDDAAPIEMQQTLLDAMMDDDDASRIVLSHDSFLGVPGRAVESNQLYTTTSFKMPRLRNLFGQSQVEIFIALRDPATFIPAVFGRAKEPEFAKFIEGSDPLGLRWSDMITRLRAAVPDAPVTVWCNEDTPLIWHEILRAMSGHDEFTVLDGRDDFLGELMRKGGLARMQSYLEAHPPKNELQRRRIVSAFLDKFAMEDALEEEIDLPGWTEDYVEQLSALYDEDVEKIALIEGVTLLRP